MKAADIMTRRVVSVAPGASVIKAAQLMLKHHVSGLPVVDHDNSLVGIVTEGDFLRRPETGTVRRRSRWLDVIFGPAEQARSYVHSHGMDVREVMTDKVVSVAESTPLDRVVHLMETHRIKRLPVLRGGKIVGIVSRANLMRALASVHRGDRSASKNDAVTRNRILTEIEGQGWSVGANVDVVVRSGVADIWGSVADPAQRDALKVLVERTPGVKGTVDHLSWEGDVTPT